MYIENYWNDFAGAGDDAMYFIDYLAAAGKPEISVSEIFEETGLDQMNGKFRQTDVDITLPISGIDADIPYAIDIIVAIGALLLECQENGYVNLGELGAEDDLMIKVTATNEEYDMIVDAIKDYANNPELYDVSEMMDEEELEDIASGLKEMADEM